MSQRSLIEFNHDFSPRGDDAALLAWANAMLIYLASGDPRHLPAGAVLLARRHHTETYPTTALEELP